MSDAALPSAKPSPTPEPSPEEPGLPWRFLAVLAVVGVALAVVAYQADLAERVARAARRAGTPRGAEAQQAVEQLRAHALGVVLALASLATAALAGFHPRVVTALRGWAPRRLAALGAVLAAGPTVVLGLRTLTTAKGFDPYGPAILAAVGAAAVLAGRRLEPRGLGGVGLALWLLLWIPFDLRWYRSVWLAPAGVGFGYPVFALTVTALGVLAFAVAGRHDLGLRPPRLRDLAWAVGPLVPFALIAIPIGLATGFLTAGSARLGPLTSAAAAVGILVTIALPEELFFRGVLDARLQESLPDRPWLSLAISSAAFGLMHWNNVHDLQARLVYLGLASVAGAFYGLAFRRSGGLFAAMLMHTLVDLIWKVFLER